MTRQPSNVQTRILETVERQLRRPGGDRLTLDTVASETGCAKGLITYHFKSKGELLGAAAKRLFRERDQRWEAALQGRAPEDVIRQTWLLINADVSAGFWRAQVALASLTESVTVQTVNKAMESFSGTLAESVTSLLETLGLKPTISSVEMGHLVAAAVQGFGMQLASGMSAKHVEGAHDALWVGLLALTVPRGA